MHITHLTSSHPRYDTRIFLKECVSIAKAGYDITLIVADGKGDELIDGVEILDVGKENSRKAQLLNSPKKVFQKALEIDADVYHFHDPELIFIANKLRKIGKKVVYDVHEDVPRVLISRSWLNKILRYLIAYIFELFENYFSRRYSAIVVVTPHISKRFSELSSKVVQVSNFPLLEEVPLNIQNMLNLSYKKLCYIGAIDRVRGIHELLDALILMPDFTLLLAGNYESEEFRKEIEAHNAYKQVEYLGYLNRPEIMEVLANSSFGMLTLCDTPNHRYSYPIKMFEYMMVGLPIIASNFETWKEIIEKHQVGICVNPESPIAIAEAVKKIFENEDLTTQFSKNGKKAINESFNWESEAKKLTELYKQINKF